MLAASAALHLLATAPFAPPQKKMRRSLSACGALRIDQAASGDQKI
jgi:hypothetical protein